MWPHRRGRAADAHVDWADFAPELTGHVRSEFPELPPAGLAFALRMWGRMHGLIALEVYGHLRPQTADPAKLFRAEMDELVDKLGL
ncbi:TetR-like C-terminal domain-containing protein [Nocardia sp. NPDC002869]|uniref:TetR-like C-terminal domain-containing protein n=1 Tax=Nocardia sp. NPDC002869 TaxID=3161032 RepID=UPI00398CBE7F